jgi:hypothetical protein
MLNCVSQMNGPEKEFAYQPTDRQRQDPCQALSG